MNAKYILLLVLLVYMALFLLKNSSPEVVDFLFFKLRTSKAALIIFSAVIGLVIGSILVTKQMQSPEEKK